MRHEITVPIYDWDRWPEVVEYALKRKIDLDAAIIELTNAGLSHHETTDER